MFITNKYLSIYFNIINNSKDRTNDGPIENHHIIPKCLGGSNKKENLAKLTPREHFICHRLLIKITSGEAKRKMCYALWRMCHNSKHHKRVITSKQYAYARKMFIACHKGHTPTEESKIKLSKSIKGKPRPWAKDAISKHHAMVNAGQKINHSTKRWQVTDPTGKIYTVDNLSAFCKERKLSSGNLGTTGKTKGYSAICLGFVRDLEVIQ